jgi:ribose-phosphate pyrophosphokinase
MVVTDSIQLNAEARNCGVITQLTIAELFGKAIRRIHNDDSISALFI